MEKTKTDFGWRGKKITYPIKTDFFYTKEPTDESFILGHFLKLNVNALNDLFFKYIFKKLVVRERKGTTKRNNNYNATKNFSKCAKNLSVFSITLEQRKWTFLTVK